MAATTCCWRCHPCALCGRQRDGVPIRRRSKTVSGSHARAPCQIQTGTSPGQNAVDPIWTIRGATVPGAWHGEAGNIRLSRFRCGRNSGGFTIVRLTIKKRMRATLAAIRATLMRRRHEPVPVVGRWLGRVVNGYFNYHAVPGNMFRLSGFLSEVCRSWRHALLRRSQRHRLQWARFNCLVRKYLPPCRVVHPFPSERLHVNTFGRSRMQ